LNEFPAIMMVDNQDRKVEGLFETASIARNI